MLRPKNTTNDNINGGVFINALRMARNSVVKVHYGGWKLPTIS